VEVPETSELSAVDKSEVDEKLDDKGDVPVRLIVDVSADVASVTRVDVAPEV
jgi:hypothetical protein